MRNFLSRLRTGSILFLLIAFVCSVNAQPLLTDYTKVEFKQKVDVPILAPATVDNDVVVVIPQSTVYQMLTPVNLPQANDVSTLFLLNQRTELSRLHYYAEMERLSLLRTRVSLLTYRARNAYQNNGYKRPFARSGIYRSARE